MTLINHLIEQLKTTTGVIIALVCSFLMPIATVLIVVGLFIFADTITGIWKSIKKQQKITSKRLSNVISKMVLYQSAVVLFFVLEKYILGDMVLHFISVQWFLTKLVALTLVSIELTSINENIYAVTGFSFWNKFKDLLKRTKEIKDEISDVSKKE